MSGLEEKIREGIEQKKFELLAMVATEALKSLVNVATNQGIHISLIIEPAIKKDRINQ